MSLRSFTSGIRALFYRRRLNAELSDELRDYIESATAEKMKNGMSREEALRAAKAEMGSAEAVKDEVRDVGWEARFYSIGQDLRYALRMLRKHPGFTTVAVLSLALGIGANTALFSLYNAVFLKRLPVQNPGDLVVFDWKIPAKGKRMYRSLDGMNRTDASGVMSSTSFPYIFFERLRDSGRTTLTSVFAFAPVYQFNVNVDGQADIASGLAASGEYFSGLGASASVGRTFTTDDDRSNAPPVAVISYGYWQRRFGADPHVAGKVVRVNNLAVTIVGVSGPGFSSPMDQQAVDVTIPLAIDPLVRGPESYLTSELPVLWWTRVMARRKPGVSREQIEATVQPLFQQTALDTWKMGPMREGDDKLTIADAQTLHVLDGSRGLTDARRDFTQPIAILMSIVALVLLIACVNVANMLLARSEARQREIAVRLAIGAGRARVLRQLLTESILLSLVSGVLGTMFALGIRGTLPALVPWTEAVEIDIDLRVLAFTVGISLLTGLLFGLAPAMRALHVGVGTSLKEGARASSSRASTAIGKGLVVVQVALSVVLLVAAGLFLRTLRNLEHADLGFATDHLLLFRVDPRLSGYKPDQIQPLYDRLSERLSGVPGVKSVAISRHPLLAFSARIQNVTIPGKGDVLTYVNLVGPGFFETMNLPLVMGRGITQHDDTNSPKVAVVNQTAARKLFGTDNPLGRRVNFGVRDVSSFEVVGVSRDAKYSNVRQEVPPTAYVAIRQDAMGQANFALRTAVDPMSVAGAVRAAVHDVDGNLPIFDVKSQADYANASINQERLFAGLSTSFGGLALALAAIGLFGVMSYSVARRTSEIAIRMALGARQRGVLFMVVRETLAMVVIGIVIGAPSALGATRLAQKTLEEVLFGLKARDPLTFVIAVAGLLAIGILAAYIPARRAASVDPMVALRYE